MVDSGKGYKKINCDKFSHFDIQIRLLAGGYYLEFVLEGVSLKVVGGP